MLESETHGRRDTVFIYSGNKLEAVVKEHLKLKVPGAGENPIVAKFYHLFRDTREEYPVATEVGAWGGAEFVRVVMRHKQRMQKYPDEPPAFGVPYEGITNLRPESKAAVVVIISDQTEIQVNDCVVVENPGNTNANIRRVDSVMCDPASAEVVTELQDEMMEEAEECAAAKRELAAAETDSAFDRALRKVEILCNM